MANVSQRDCFRFSQVQPHRPGGESRGFYFVPPIAASGFAASAGELQSRGLVHS